MSYESRNVAIYGFNEDRNLCTYLSYKKNISLKTFKSKLKRYIEAEISIDGLDENFLMSKTT